MKTATSVFAIRCRIAIDVVGFVEFDGRLCCLTLLLDTFHSTTQKDTGKLKSFLQELKECK